MQSKMSPSKILFFLSISFIAGILLESIIKIPSIFIWGFFVFGFLSISIYAFVTARGISVNFAVAEFMPIVSFCTFFIILGILRVQISDFNIANDELSKLNGTGQVVLEGTISNEPDVRDTFQKLEVRVKNSIILVTTGRYPEYKYLDKITLTGKLEEPSVTDSFNYKNYLMKDGIYSVMGFPKISAFTGRDLVVGGEVTVIQKIYSGILFCKQKIRASIQSNFLPPQSSILEGTILGDNGAMTNDLKSKLNITGLRHVIAVSGTHVVILSMIMMYLLLAVGLWRGQAFYVAIIFIVIYIVLTGLPSSGVATKRNNQLLCW